MNFMWPMTVIALIACIGILGWQSRANERAVAEACVAAGNEWRPDSAWTRNYVCVKPAPNPPKGEEA